MAKRASAQRFGLLLLVRRSLRQHLLSTSVTVFSLAIAAGLVMALFSIQRQSRAAFASESSPFDAVLGARGSALQLVLNSVFHLETSPGNLRWSAYESIRAAPGVKTALPYAVGDHYRGFRVVGTDARHFDPEVVGPRAARVGRGRVFDDTLREMVAGAYAARALGLEIGAQVRPYHSLAGDRHQHDEEYVVVGILETTNTPVDRVLWIPLEGVYRMGGHVLRGAGVEYTPHQHEDIPDEHKEVSAVMLQLDSPQAGMRLDAEINRRGRDATFAHPIARVMLELLDKLGWTHRVLALVAYLTVAVAIASILASLYNTMNERRREFAILRALGARRRTVFAAIVLESATLAGLGSLAGFAVHAAIHAIAARILREQTGVVLFLAEWHPVFVLTPAAIIALGALAGVLPAWRAYRTDVARGLLPLS